MFRRGAAIASLVLFAACSSRPAAADFTLVSDSGAAWRLSGRHAAVLLSFGFTHCPDTCPALLARLSRLAASARARGQTVDVAMITVDPQRDRPPQLHAFVSHFPGTTGLTGTQAQIDAVETAYGVWAQRLPKNNGNYDYAHATAVYFIDPNGRIAAIRDDTDTDASLLSALNRAVTS
jgi:protein SCO1/2